MILSASAPSTRRPAASLYLRDDVDTRDLLKHLVDIAKNCSVEVSVLVKLEAVHKGTTSHLFYGILDGFELALNLWVLPAGCQMVLIGCTSNWTYGGRSLRAQRTSSASSSLPLRTSQRGDSGRPGIKTRMIIARKIWKAIGNLQATLLFANDKPRSIQ